MSSLIFPMKNNKIAVCTTTFYPEYKADARDDNSVDHHRGDLALETVSKAVEQGYQVIVVDGGSSSDFTSALASNKAVQIRAQKESGIGPSRREAFMHAGNVDGVETICWTEPEKTDYLNGAMVDGLMAFFETDADLMVVGRNDLSCLPKGQQDSEIRCNNVINHWLKKEGWLEKEDRDWDWYSGFKIVRNTQPVRDLLNTRYAFDALSDHPLDAQVNPDRYSNSLFIPFIQGLNPDLNGPRSATTWVDYTHSPRMKDYEEAEYRTFKEKRDMQRATILGSLKHFRRLLLGQESQLRETIAPGSPLESVRRTANSLSEGDYEVDQHVIEMLYEGAERLNRPLSLEEMKNALAFFN